MATTVKVLTGLFLHSQFCFTKQVKNMIQEQLGQMIFFHKLFLLNFERK